VGTALIVQVLLSRLPFWKTKTAALADFELIGERVTVRPLRESDAEAMFLFASDPKVTEYLPWYPAPSVEVVRVFIKQQRARRKHGDSVGTAVLLKETGQMIGSTDIMQLKSGEKGSVEFGYILAQPFWGMGLMSEAAALTIKYAFEQLKREKVIAWADQDNSRSRRVLAKLGLRESENEWREIKNTTRLYVRYELSKTAWDAKK
jgi:[ribosomal protein S5]-alanine N-acetyltransferase